VSVRIGWSLQRPRERKPGRIAGGLWLFQLLKVDGTRGRHVVVGALTYTREDLQRVQAKGYKLDVRVIGLLRLGKDVTSELLNATIERVRVTGKILSPAHLMDSLNQ
jgi:hypothetical protein